jgi:hypothetical protein
MNKSSDHWLYAGPLRALQDPNVTVSLKGHTAHVIGYLPSGTTLPELPHVKTRPDGNRTRVDIVYPIATARPGKSNSRPGVYSFYQATPYRPDGMAWTQEEGEHHVTWGGFPFLAYNQGIAFHGPITSELNGSRDASVWYLRRGAVSGGCNRMMGEHVVEMAHVLGVDMRKIYTANRAYTPTTRAKVTAIADYDQLDGKYIDVDYATDVGVTRPGVTYGRDKVVMFGSWVATETPDGKDLPPGMKWQGGVSGTMYDFSQHAIRDRVCSVPKGDLARMKAWTARLPENEVPLGFCAKKKCALDALVAGADPVTRCQL